MKIQGQMTFTVKAGVQRILRSRAESSAAEFSHCESVSQEITFD